MDCSLPGSSIHGIFQARVLEWDAITFSVPIHRKVQKSLTWYVCFCDLLMFNSMPFNFFPSKNKTFIYLGLLPYLFESVPQNCLGDCLLAYSLRYSLQTKISSQLSYCVIFFSGQKSEREVAQSCPTLSDPHGLQPTRILHPWDFPGKSTGVGCHCLLRSHT